MERLRAGGGILRRSGRSITRLDLRGGERPVGGTRGASGAAVRTGPGACAARRTRTRASRRGRLCTRHPRTPRCGRLRRASAPSAALLAPPDPPHPRTLPGRQAVVQCRIVPPADSLTWRSPWLFPLAPQPFLTVALLALPLAGCGCCDDDDDRRQRVRREPRPTRPPPRTRTRSSSRRSGRRSRATCWRPPLPAGTRATWASSKRTTTTRAPRWRSGDLVEWFDVFVGADRTPSSTSSRGAGRTFCGGAGATGPAAPPKRRAVATVLAHASSCPRSRSRALRLRARARATGPRRPEDRARARLIDDWHRGCVSAGMSLSTTLRRLPHPRLAALVVGALALAGCGGACCDGRASRPRAG